jgi:pimeloyl-ACP methyl ester carboxylesterase
MRDDIVERLFSLFAPSDRVETLAGDLMEERQHRGSFWYWLQVIRVTFVLWRCASAEAPLRMLGLALVACGLFVAPALAGLAAVLLFPQLVGSAMSWAALSVFWCGGALLAGALLVTISPRRGMATCTAVAAISAAVLIALGANADHTELTSPVGRMFFITALGTTLALLLGGAMASRRTVLIAVPFAVVVGLAATVLFVISTDSSTSAQPNEWRDPSPHTSSFLTVDDGVQVEVLDWGGSGRPLLLMHGDGDSAHAFDDLAPVLATRYRVVGFTRRGHRGSSAPDHGYEFARLAEDTLRVMDSVRLQKPVLVGHSGAGEVMHVLGARHMDRIAGLVYIDAAFDRGDNADSEKYNAVARTLPGASGPESSDLASIAALRSYSTNVQGLPFSEAYLRARWVLNPDGTIARMWAPDRPVIQAMSKAMHASYNPYKPETIHAPALGVYAVPMSADDFMRRGSSDRPPFPAAFITKTTNDSTLRARVEQLYLLTRERARNHEKWFAAYAEHGRIVEISGAHHLFISNPEDVAREIDGFMTSVVNELSPDRR